jgi:ElaA protein
VTDLQHATGDDLTPAQLYALLKLRVDVFVVEQECPYSELDGRDLLPGTVHVWYESDGTVLGCLRLLREPNRWRIGRVCTAKETRGTGLGARLMSAAMTHIGDSPAVLDAQTYATAFYARYGFVATGDPFDEDGIEHITMLRP